MEFSPFRAVRAFHQAIDADGPTTPHIPAPSIAALRQTLLHEEYHELVEALKGGDLAAIAGEAADLLYVTYGLCVAYGIDADAVFDAVQQANLAKIHGPRRADGKLLKPDDWTAPNIVGVLEQQAQQVADCPTIALTVTVHDGCGSFLIVTPTETIDSTLQTITDTTVGYETLFEALQAINTHSNATLHIQAPRLLGAYLYVQQPIPQEFRAVDQRVRLLLASFRSWQAVPSSEVGASDD